MGDSGCWSCDDRSIACSFGPKDAESVVVVWDPISRKVRHQMALHTAQIQELVPHPCDPSVMLTISTDARAVVWDVDMGTVLRAYSTTL